MDKAKQRKHWRDCDPATRKCDCGNPAVILRNNAYVCARCAEIEGRMRRGDDAAGYVERGRFGRRASYVRVIDPYPVHLKLGF